MEEKRYTRRVQRIVLAGASLLLLLLIAAWINEGISREWKRHQKEYAGILESLHGKVEGRDRPEKGIFQVELPQFDRVDRCISCHNGISDPSMAQAGQPHTMHPGNFLSDHPLGEYGCTICHGGQGRALSKVEAFGQDAGAHWPYPLLEHPYIQALCGKCHLALFDRGSNSGQATVEGMEVFVMGLEIFSREGCLGCHKARGTGGILGPDLTRQGEKTKHEYSFQNVAGEQTVSNWLKEHFKDPEMVSPGSRMLQIDLQEDKLDALATLVMGLSRPEIPLGYFTLPTLHELKGIRPHMDGSSAYAFLCSACHGKKGEGKNYREYLTGIPSIGNRDFLRVASESFISFTIEKGRSLKQMGSWAGSISGMDIEELDALAIHLKEQGRRAARPDLESGDAEIGEKLFDEHCSVCHGPRGAGGIAVALNQPGFLTRAEDPFILETLLRGRGNSAMPGWSHLGDTELAGLVAAIRNWIGPGPGGGDLELPEPDLEEGGMRYHFLCSRCHGEFGEGATGPSVINRDFLQAAGNRFLYETIAQGRAHTAMFGWSSDVYHQERLSIADISSIVGFMRYTADRPLDYIHPGGNPGDREAGAELFAGRCASCHGPAGEGIRAPALNNQEFLSAASNGYLMATITIGRSGTDMPGWGYGQGEYPALSGKQRHDLVAFLRAWQRIRIKF